MSHLNYLWLSIILLVHCSACDSRDIENPGGRADSNPWAIKSEHSEAVAEFEDGNPAVLIDRFSQIRSSQVVESSGIAVTDPLLESFWTHNDSGGDAELYLISASTGELEKTVRLSGAKNIDWEDMGYSASAERCWLMVADVGDNDKKRKDYQLYLFDLTIVDDQSKQTLKKGQIQKIEFEYEDGPRDCEAVTFADNGRTLLLVEKLMNPLTSHSSGVYQLDIEADFSKNKRQVAKRIASIQTWAVTAMDVSPDQQDLILRSYAGALLFRKKDNGDSWSDVLQHEQPQIVSLPVQQQGEAICFTADGKHVIITSEGKETIVWKVKLHQLQQ